jgi:hypothetical protein
MFRIQNLTDQPRQKQTLFLPDGTFIQMSIYFIPMQLGWFIPSLVYQGFVLNGLRITNSPNFLYQFKNQIPFGIACFSDQEREPTQQEDFLSGASRLFVLTAEEVEQYTRFLSG